MNILCNGFPWWLIIGLLLAIIFVVLILVFDWMGIRTTLTTTRRFPRICKLAGLLLAVYLAFFLAAILNQFLPSLCRAKESIYYWKLAEYSQSGIDVKPVNSDQAPTEFTELNRQGNCVACHTVSRSTKMIAAVTDNFNGRIVLMGLDGEKIDTPELRGSYLSFSPDGTKLAFSKNDRDIAIYDIANQTTSPLTGASDPDIVETMPSWSGDGSTIAFVRPVSGMSGDFIEVPCDIYTVNATGGTATILPGAGGDGFNYYPAYSPDGRWLAFTRQTTGNTTYAADQAEIFVIPAKGGEAVRIAANDAADGTRLENVSNSWASWSPDSHYLTFSSKRTNGQYDIFITNIDDQGNSGYATPIEGADDPLNFEHLPYWGEPPIPNIGRNILNLWPWLIPLLFLIPLLLLGCKKPEPLKPTLKIERSVSPDRGRLKRDLFMTTIELIGDTCACEGVVDVKPVDVALVIDISDSMEEPLSSAKAAARQFIDKLDIGRDQVAVIPFDDQARIAHDLDGDRAKIISAVDSLTVQGGTAIDQGLKAAYRVITGPERRVEAEPAIILLSDGGSAEAAALFEAEKIKNEKIRLITIGFGESADQNLLGKLASTPQDFYFAPNGSSLSDIYKSIAEKMHKLVAATNIEVTHLYDAENFELIRESIIPAPKRVEAGKITWFFDHIGTTHRIMNYKVKPLNIGEHEVDLGDNISYLRCGKDLSNLSCGRDLSVTVLEPGINLPPHHVHTDPFQLTQPNVVWQPSNALIIGIGGTGRRIVTQVKKSLLDSGAGNLPDNIRLMVIDTSEYEKINGQKQDVSFAGVSVSKEEVFVLNENLSKLVTDPGSRNKNFEWFPYERYLGKKTEYLQLANGTNGERPLARLGLIQALSKLEVELRKNIKKAYTVDEDGSKKIHIIISGSIAGGMSGIIPDIAYISQRLAREEYGEDASIILEGYLVLSTGLPGNWINPNDRKANCFASRRELQRFQLNPGLKYPMVFGNPDTSAFLDQKLFSRLHLFDNGVLKISVEDLIASISDQITLRLDKAAGVVGPADWLNGSDDLIDNKQNELRELVVRSAGIFTYRIPVLDIMNYLENRWVNVLLNHFLGKDTSNQVKDNFYLDHPAETLTRLFLADPNGLLNNTEQDENLRILQVFNDILNSEHTLDYSKVIPQPEQVNPDEIVLSIDKALNTIASITLSGNMEEVDVESDLFGRIGYWKGFLETLRNHLLTVQNTITKTSNQTEAFPQDQSAVLLLIVRRLIEALNKKKTQFLEVAGLISSTKFDNQNRTNGLLESVDEVLADLTHKQLLMDELKVRRYAWDRKLDNTHQSYVDYLYEKYATDERDPRKYVKYLNWVTEPGKGIGLELLVRTKEDGNTFCLFDSDGLSGFYSGLKQLSNSVLQNAWSDEEINLERAFFGDGVPDVRNYSRSLLTHQQADSLKKSRIFAYSKDQSKPHVLPELRNQSVDDEIIVPSTDKYSISLINSDEVIPISAINGYDSLLELYYIDQKVNHRAAYLEESQATKIEQITNAAKIFHPLVVAGFVNLDRAEWFSLAYALRWVNNENGRVTVKIDGKEYTLVNTQHPSVDSLVYAFLRFCYGEPENIDLPLIQDPDEQEVQKWRENWTRIPNNLVINAKPELISLGELMQYYINKRSREIAIKNFKKNEGK